MRFLGGLHIAVVILVLSLGVGLYADIKSEQMHGQNLQIQVGLERMVRLNQSLTSLVALTVIEKNSLRAASYPSLQSELESTMQEVETLTQHLTLAAEIRTLRGEQRALRALERKAFDLMRGEQWEAAFKALLGDDHVMALKLYEINSETAVGALTLELANSARQQDQLRHAMLALRLAAVALLLLTGWRYSNRLQRELTEQMRLRTKVTHARDMLEEKVQQRTAELQAANSLLETLSTTDGLTGLANRRRFDNCWAEEWQRALRQGTSLAVIMLDVDHFKDYNDFYGHPQGDVCLRLVADVLQASVRRAGELAARYGGEEFVVVLPGASLAQAQETAQALLLAIRAAQIPHANSPVADRVTISLGVAAGSPCLSDRRDRLLIEADVALYEAKHQGRNGVALALNEGVATA